MTHIRKKERTQHKVRRAPLTWPPSSLISFICSSRRRKSRQPVSISRRLKTPIYSRRMGSPWDRPRLPGYLWPPLQYAKRDLSSTAFGTFGYCDLSRCFVAKFKMKWRSNKRLLFLQVAKPTRRSTRGGDLTIEGALAVLFFFLDVFVNMV